MNQNQNKKKRTRSVNLMKKLHPKKGQRKHTLNMIIDIGMECMNYKPQSKVAP